MLTAKQVDEIRQHLEQAQNPLFLFDNDPDGLCSFLILRKFCGKGKGVPIRSYPSMNSEYFRKVNELKADYIFILDKPLVGKDFFDEAEKVNIPVVWIDHHKTDEIVPKSVNYYNPMLNKEKTNEPVTHLCYQVSQRKEDMWLDVVGCIADHFVPEKYGEFREQFPEICIDSKEPFGILYKSQIGKIAKMFSFALKDTTTNVVNMLKFLVKAKSPHDVLEENSETQAIHRRFSQIDKKYSRLLDKAKALDKNSNKLIFFKYAGDLSIGGELSNELSYLFPKKFIVVLYFTMGKVNFSARGNKVKDLILKAIEDIPGSRGGGHENAVGGQIRPEDVDVLRENLERLVG